MKNLKDKLRKMRSRKSSVPYEAHERLDATAVHARESGRTKQGGFCGMKWYPQPKHKLGS